RLPDPGQSGSTLYYCDGSRSWDGNSSDTLAPGWPCLSQTGRNAGKTMAQIAAGDKQASFPLYLWNNGPQDSCSDPSTAGANCDNSFSVSHSNASALAYFKASPHTTTGFGNGDVDYQISAGQPTGAGTHTLRYAPYTYPYPATAP